MMLRCVLAAVRWRAGVSVRATLAPADLLPCPARPPAHRARHMLCGGPPGHHQLQQRRHIWGWLNAIFNKVDASRIDAVGPDRACAEWLLRCGAHFRWRSHPHWETDYNALAAVTRKKMFIEEINADNAAIMHIGFHHFRGMNAVRKIRFHYCGYLDDTALGYLDYLAHCLESLEISSCGNVTAKGISHLAKLKALKELRLYDLPEIAEREQCVHSLQKLLPKCSITFPPPVRKPLQHQRDKKV